ncbi:hypothetical protein D5270_14070 [Acutalibacter sp. 1XD8-36]|nr:hypothetical protein [Acutalibacter sp. 1XD8-36]
MSPGSGNRNTGGAQAPQIWCEGTFAAQKWGHNMARVLRRGLEAVENHCLLSPTALNLKRTIRSMD